MPNHVTNILAVKSGDPSEVWQKIAGDENRPQIDFNQIVPMPEILKGDSALPKLEDMAMLFLGEYPFKELLSLPSGNALDAAKSGNWGEAAGHLKQINILKMLETKLAGDLSDEDFEILIKYMRALREHGHANWYEWSVSNWGTKWNAYSQSRNGEREIQFETAWSTPSKIWSQLSKMFPEHEFHIAWADEDTGSNTGEMVVANGMVLSGGPFDNSTPEAYRNAVKVKWGGKLPEDMRWTDNGTVEYIDD